MGLEFYDSYIKMTLRSLGEDLNMGMIRVNEFSTKEKLVDNINLIVDEFIKTLKEKKIRQAVEIIEKNKKLYDIHVKIYTNNCYFCNVTFNGGRTYQCDGKIFRVCWDCNKYTAKDIFKDL